MFSAQLVANRHHFSQNTPSTFPPTVRDAEEVDSLRPQIAIPKPGRGGRRKLIYAFNEQGVAKPSRKAVGFHRGKSEPKKQQAVGIKKGGCDFSWARFGHSLCPPPFDPSSSPFPFVGI
jgi:hypothetical protein